jgi:Tol biopolymer transport system component/DNA-binding winged helix-turn-helix (wHTH) protein
MQVPFGDFVLDVDSREVRRGTDNVKLSPKAFQLLEILAVGRPRAFSKAELQDRLWPGTFVVEKNLANLVAEIREALGDNRSDQRFIRTVPRYGYSFRESTSPGPVDAGSPPQTSRLAGLHWRRTWRSMSLGLAVVVLSAVVWWVWRREAPKNGGLAIPLTTLPGTETSPALSPDGHVVAFSWSGSEQQGQLDIYLKAVGAEVLRRLTEHPASELSPAWSPDGQEIAFVRIGHGVFVISQLGGPERRVSDSGSLVGWTPDGKSVLIRDQNGAAGFSLYQIMLDTLERRRLTDPSIGIGDWKFEVSPDGATLAFIRHERPGVGDLYLMPMRGGAHRRLTDWNAAVEGVAWMPDGRELVYSAMGRLWRVSANASRPTHGTAIVSVSDGAQSPSISRPLLGRPIRLAFQKIVHDIGLRLIDLQLARSLDDTLEAKPLVDSTRIDSPGAFSPDATAVAFKSLRGGDSPELWVCGRDGHNLRQVTHMLGVQLVVSSWSPDGKRILFDASIGANSDIYSVDAAGGQPRRLTSDEAIDLLPWSSRDGRWIYFTSLRSGIPQIWRMAADGGTATQVTRNGGIEAQDSPDGQYLYYLDRPPSGSTGASGTSKLMRARVDGSSEVPVLDAVRFLSWSVTDHGIVFLERSDDDDSLALFRFDDGRVVALGRLPFRVATTSGRLIASTDGRWVLANTVDRFDADLMLLDDFR